MISLSKQRTDNTVPCPAGFRNLEILSLQPKNVQTPLVVTKGTSLSFLDFLALRTHTVFRVTLPGKVQVVIDITRLQHGWKEFIAPWDKYEQHRVQFVDDRGGFPFTQHAKQTTELESLNEVLEHFRLKADKACGKNHARPAIAVCLTRSLESHIDEKLEGCKHFSRPRVVSSERDKKPSSLQLGGGSGTGSHPSSAGRTTGITSRPTPSRSRLRLVWNSRRNSKTSGSAMKSTKSTNTPQRLSRKSGRRDGTLSWRNSTFGHTVDALAVRKFHGDGTGIILGAAEVIFLMFGRCHRSPATLIVRLLVLEVLFHYPKIDNYPCYSHATNSHV